MSLILFTKSTSAQIPSGYYSSVEGLEHSSLKEGLHNIIKGHRVYPYTSSSTDTWDILKEADKDPDNSANVLGIYSAFSMNGAAEYANGSGWSREHVWAKSRGDFDTDETAGTDCHNLRAEDVSTNIAKGNRSFDECSTPYVDGSGTYRGSTDSFTSTSSYVWKPREDVKGDIARIIFYMATRYEGGGSEPDLELTEDILDREDKSALHGKLSTLLNWHNADPVSQAERDRNDIIYGYQNNRNPFIDHPEYVQLIWNSNGLIVGVEETLSNVRYLKKEGMISITGSQNQHVLIVNIFGQIVYETSISGTADLSISNLNQGLHIILVQNGLNRTSTRILID